MVITLGVYKVLLELVKAVLIFWSIRIHRLVHPYFTSNLIRASPFLPLLHAVDINFVDHVFLFKASHIDYVLFVFDQGLLNRLPLE
jgi:hypothetical protein